ncbi:toll/interleukin-1 receptor domain-containing protein [Qipengyuania sp. DGS5-3]|uniref:toll/interleukin-1 receptor domain-containing protein n=1 Tax=Qipengyuania sp. DGS5-3 TaxID=3349632 RepID=UPI0036D3DA7B
MSYDFASLSPTEFEELARELVGAELKIRFEAFAEGPDSGMDGRHCTGGDSTILQAKHYHRSGPSKLKSKMAAERETIDRLAPHRYILVTSAALTPHNKSELRDTIGPSLQNTGDIFGPDDLNALLRKHPEIEKAHSKLWAPSTGILKKVIAEAFMEAQATRDTIPEVFERIFKPKSGDANSTEKDTLDVERDMIFLIKTTPGDDEFALWLAPKLEAAGYSVYADILTLEPGDRWRRVEDLILQHRTAKALLVMTEDARNNRQVQDNIDIALEVAKELEDDRFIIPLRLQSGKKIKGIGDAIAVDFVRGWGEGLTALLESLQRQKVPKPASGAAIDPNWDLFRRRGSIALVNEPERLTSNWLRVLEAPDSIHYFENVGVGDEDRARRAAATLPFPAVPHGRGLITFAEQCDIDEWLMDVGRFALAEELDTLEFAESGWPALDLERQPASNMMVRMFREAWEAFCKERGFAPHAYSNATGFHPSPELAPRGKKIPWGRQGSHRSSMLRNVARGHIWQYGVTGMPFLWPFWHFKLKSRVLFAVDNGTEDGEAIDDHRKMHRLRRSNCKGWRNKQWHGRMLAFLELLSGETAYLRLAVSSTSAVVLDATPILFNSPVSTELPDELDADAEEPDVSTLGRPESALEEEA